MMERFTLSPSPRCCSISTSVKGQHARRRVNRALRPSPGLKARFLRQPRMIIKQDERQKPPPRKRSPHSGLRWREVSRIDEMAVQP